MVIPHFEIVLRNFLTKTEKTMKSIQNNQASGKDMFSDLIQKYYQPDHNVWPHVILILMITSQFYALAALLVV
jgi:hypothetical protein